MVLLTTVINMRQFVVFLLMCGLISIVPATLSAKPNDSARACERGCNSSKKPRANSGKCYWLYTNGSYVYVCR
jgi:hypothetical protein